MDFLRRIEDDVRNLGVEAKRKNPEVREAAERSLLTLRTMRESYVSEVMRGSGSNTPKIAKFRSADVSSAYILACEKVDANPKLVKLSLNGLQMLLNYEVVPPSEAKNILRILTVQAQSGNTEIQLKALQIVLQLANSLAIDIFASQYLTVENVSGMLCLALQLCSYGEGSSTGSTNVSVSSTAFATVRQLIALVMDSTSEVLAANSNLTPTQGNLRSSSAQENLPKCAILLIKDLSRFIRGQSGEWMRDLVVNPSAAIDLLHAVLSGWPHLFLFNPTFKGLLKHPICTSLVPLLKTLQEDYVNTIRQRGNNSHTTVSPSLITSRIVKLARCILLDYQHSPDLVLEMETITTCLVHTLQPERGLDIMVRQLPNSNSLLGDGSNNRDQKGIPNLPDGNNSNRHDDQSPAGLISRLAISKNNNSPGISTVSGGIPSKGGSVLALAALIPASMQSSNISPLNGSNSVVFIPSHPAGVALEAVLAMFMNDDICCVIARGENGEEALPTILTSVVLTVSCMLSESLAVESNIKEFESNARSSQLVTLMEGVLAGSSELDRPYVIRAIHDQLFNGTTTIGSADVILLAFLVLQIATRLLVKSALSSTSIHKNNNNHKSKKLFPSSDDSLLLPENIAATFLSDRWIPPSNFSNSSDQSEKQSNSSTKQLSSNITQDQLVTILQKSVATVCERTFDRAQEACLALLSKIEDTGVIRRSLGILAELALTAGILGLQRTCDSLVSTLCRLTVPQWHGQDLVPIQQEQSVKERPQSISRTVSESSTTNTTSSLGLLDGVTYFRWRHVQALIRLTQVVHVLADVITDWEVIVDSFEQLILLLLTSSSSSSSTSSSSYNTSNTQLINQTNSSTTGTPGPKSTNNNNNNNINNSVVIHDELTSMDVDRIFECIERFKGFTVFISDESLMRLMTSLVALSLNSLANSSSSSSTLSPSLNNQQMINGNNSNNSNNTPPGVSTPLKPTTRLQASPSISQAPPNLLPSQPVGGNTTILEIPPNAIIGPTYMIDALSTRALNYSLHAAIEVAKKNAYRMSCVWQMVTSHLRMMSSNKIQRIRRLAVAATHDVITTTLNFLRNESIDEIKNISYVDENNLSGPNRWRSVNAAFDKETGIPQLCDDLLYDGVMPPFETVFSGRKYQKLALIERCNIRKNLVLLGSNQSSNELVKKLEDEPPLLTQADLLSCLKSLSTYTTYPDVRNDIMQGLLELLQGGGQALHGGWSIIINLLMSVPASMVPQDTLENLEMPLTSSWINDDQNNQNNNSNNSNNLDSEELSSKVWPDAALQTAFFCMKLIVDDFLESLHIDVIKNVVTCLSMFSAQLSDVNISLTSVEMLWKVTDFIMTTSRQKGDDTTTNTVLDVMLRRLLFLAMDQRPEIRNCATNTLFSAIVTNAPLLSVVQWRRAFDDVIFPLFSRVEVRSGLAMRSNEEAKAPEIKRGVKMTLHHSRDNAHKQWSETRVLALRGLSRVMKACIKHLLTENWFSRNCWVQALEICVFAAQAGDFDLEVCLAGVDSIFDMIKSVSSRAYKTKGRATAGMRVVGGALVEENPQPQKNNINEKQDTSEISLAVTEGNQEICRQALWELAWSAVRMAVCYGSSGSELPLHICKNLQELYVGGMESEFRYSQNVKSLLEMLVVLSRPRISVISTRYFENYNILRFDQDRPISGIDSADSRPPSQARSAKMGKLGIQQLHRGIISLLKSIIPHDILSFSSLIVSICDLCFTGCHYAQMSSTNLTIRTVLDQNYTSDDTENIERRIIFSPVDESLRLESSRYLIQIFRGPDGTENSDNGQSFTLPSSAIDWLATGIEVVVKKFQEELCQPLLSIRMNKFPKDISNLLKVVDNSKGNSTTSTTSTTSNNNNNNSNNRGFLFSLAKMLTLDANEIEETDIKSSKQQTPTNSSGISGGGEYSLSHTESTDHLRLMKLHVSIVSSTISTSIPTEINILSDIWRMFPVSLIILESLSTVFEFGLPALRQYLHTSKSNDLFKKSTSILRYLLPSIACLLSPWHNSLDLFISPPHISQTKDLDTLPKLNCLPPTSLDVLFINSETLHPYWISEHKQDKKQMEELIHTASFYTSNILKSSWIHFLHPDVEGFSDIKFLEALYQIHITSSRLTLRALTCYNLKRPASNNSQNQSPTSPTRRTSSKMEDISPPSPSTGNNNNNNSDIISKGDHLTYHLNCIQTSKVLLLSLFKNNISATPRVKSGILLGLLLITSDLAELSSSPEYSSVSISKYIPSSSVHMICSDFFLDLTSIETDPEILPTGKDLLDNKWIIDSPESNIDQTYDIIILRKWFSSFEEFPIHKNEDINLNTNTNRLSSFSKDSTDDNNINLLERNITSNFLKHAHLYLCFDMAKRLVFSSCTPLRTQAIKLMGETDISSLILSYRDIKHALEIEKEEKKKLTKELYSVRSAASLQF